MNFTRKNAKFAIAALALIASAGGANAASLTFSGKVGAATCTVSATGAGTITLPTISTADLVTADGTTAGDTVFTISGASCSGTPASATVYFDNTNATSAGRLASGVAGVDLELLQGTNVLDLSKVSGSQGVSSTTVTSGASGTFSTTFKVRYKRNSTAAPTATGNVSVTLTYTVTYA